MQSALRMIYPPQCVACGERTDEEFGLCGLCGPCWREAGFIAGLTCDKCGVPLPGEDPGEPVLCDDCLTIARPWSRGRAAMGYGETGRRVVLSLKHGDRLDLARPAGEWMLQVARPILCEGMIVAPVPLHWLRLLKRRYNQSALLAGRVAKLAGLDYCPDLLIRPRRTASQEGRDRDGRFANVAGAICAHPRRKRRIEGRHVLLVDDVMTSGATLAVAAEACLAAGASDVSVLALARVATAP
jgi:predicted amidophosphoribosyltransferase